ncbi:MAG: hypothetical protein V1916_01475, partial [Patescibacteria group bacterium]
VDRNFLKIACYIHDIGKMVTGSWASRHLRPDIFHLYEGYYFMVNKGYENLARVCVCHVCGAGADRQLNRQNGFIPKDFFPRSVEEKIVGYADARTDPKPDVGPYVWPISRPLTQFKKHRGVVPRLRANHRFIQRITGGTIR